MADEVDPTDEVYKALGKYIDAFSQIVWTMEWAMVDYLRRKDIPPAIGRLPFGAMGADDVRAVFFAMAGELYEHDEKEVKVAKALSKIVREEIQLRNDLAHGTWGIGDVVEVTDGDRELRFNLPPSLYRVKPGRAAGATQTIEPDLQERVRAARRIIGHLDAYGDACFGKVKDGQIRDFVRVNDSREVIQGPKRTD